MEKRHGPWQIRKTEHKYRDEFISLCVDDVIKPDGNPGTYATVQLKEGVAVLALDREGNVYLTRQFRYAIGRDSIEVISGGIDEGEDPLTAARREAREELGVEGEDWNSLECFHLETSMIKGPVHLYVVKDLHCTNTDPDDTEDIKGFRVPMEEAVQMVLRGEITHGPSCVLILKAFLAGKGNN
jgi:8-oxo-dGTP pyrophosphatase MutT (NUDIX family)